MTLHPQIIEKEGKKEFVVLPYEEFVQLQEEIEDYEDLKDLRCAKDTEGSVPTVSLAEVKKKFGVWKIIYRSTLAWDKHLFPRVL